MLTHLSPRAENQRLEEVKVISSIKENNTILMGDLNSLSPEDSYDDKLLLEQLKELGIKKFGTEYLRKDVITGLNKIFIDSSKMFHKDFQYSVPSEFNHDKAHFTKLRIDYLFISKSLKSIIKKSDIIRNEETNQLSDHFPIIAEFEG